MTKLKRLEHALNLVYDEFSGVRLAARTVVKKLWKEVFGEDEKIMW